MHHSQLWWHATGLAYHHPQMLNILGFQKALKKFEKVTKARSPLKLIGPLCVVCLPLPLD
jgi:hypothetical protein